MNEAGTWEKRNRFLITPATAGDIREGINFVQDSLETWFNRRSPTYRLYLCILTDRERIVLNNKSLIRMRLLLPPGEGKTSVSKVHIEDQEAYKVTLKEIFGIDILHEDDFTNICIYQSTL